MLSPIPLTLQIALIEIVIAVYILLAVAIRRYAAPARRVAGDLAIWLALTGTLAALGFFLDFLTLPPRIPLFVFIQAVFILRLVFFSAWGKALRKIPQKVLIGLQAFRLPLELILASLAAKKFLPIEMSFHGRNFDIITGLSAPLMALAATRFSTSKMKPALLAWNFMGLALVTNVVAYGMLSAPYPFKVLNLEADTFALGYFPLIWLPMFLVPVAYLLHLLSIVQLLEKNDR